MKSLYIGVSNLTLFSLPSPVGDYLFWPLCAVVPLRGLRCGGPVGWDKLSVPPPQANAAYGQPRRWHPVPGQQHHQLGHICGVSYQHASLDDPLVGAQQRQGAPPGLYAGQRGYGHHDSHEHRPVLSAAKERLLEEQNPGGKEWKRDVKRRGRLQSSTHSLLYVSTRWPRIATCDFFLFVCYLFFCVWYTRSWEMEGSRCRSHTI